MPSQSAIKAGAAYVELFLRDNRLTRGLKRSSRRLKQFGRSVQATGLAMARISAVAAAPFAIATARFVAFDDKMRLVKAVTQSTEREFESLTQQAKELGRTTSFTAAEVADAMVSLGRAGFKANEILAATPAILNLSRATATELGEAADITGGALRGFGLDASRAAEVADILAVTANGSAQTLIDLGESLKFVAPIARDAGANIRDVAGMLGILANNAIRGSMAGTSLRRAYQNIAKGKGADVFRELGIDIADANGDMRDLTRIIVELGQKTRQLGSVERLAIFSEIFGRGSAAAAILSKNSASIDDFADRLDKAGGAAARIAAEMDAGLGGTVRRFLSAAEGIGLAIAESIEKPLMESGRTLTRWQGVITEWIGKNQGYVRSVAKLVVVAGAASVALVGLGVSAQALGFVMGGLASIFTIIAIPVGVLGSLVASLLTPIGLLTAAFVAFGLNTTGWADRARGALGSLMERTTELRERWGRTIAAMGHALAAGKIRAAAKILWAALLVEWVRGKKAILGSGVEIKTEMIEIFFGIAKSILKSTGLTVHGVVTLWIDGIADIKRAFTELWDSVRSVQERGINWLAQQIIKLRAKVNKDIDVAESTKRLQKESDQRIRAIERERRATLDAIDSEHKARILAEKIADRKHEDRLGNAARRIQEEIEGDANRQIQQAEASLDAARKAWRDAVKQEQEEEAQARMGRAGGADQAGIGEFGNTNEILSKIANRFESISERTRAIGTFNAAAIAGLAASGAAERTAENTGTIVKQGRTTNRLLREGTQHT